MQINFEELEAKAQKNIEESVTKFNSDMDRLLQRKQRETEKATALLEKTTDRTDMALLCCMRSEIKTAQDRVESEIREKYKSMYGVRDWNRDEVKDDMRTMLKDIRK